VVTRVECYQKLILFTISACLYVVSQSSCAVKENAITSVSNSSKYRASRDRVVATARKELGDAYKYAGIGPSSWDCSGLTQYSYSKAGIKIGRSSRDIAKMAEAIDLKDAQKGDLIFFKKDGRVFHVSIITENSEDNLWVVHSTTSRGVIEEDILKSLYWEKKIYKVISLAALSDIR